MVLVASLMLTTKASDDPTHQGQAAVRGHPKVAAGSGRQKPISETPLMSSEADSEEHTMPLVMKKDNAMMPIEEVQLTNAHESNEAMIEEISEHDKVISVLRPLFWKSLNPINIGRFGIGVDHVLDGEASGRNPQQSGRAGNILNLPLLNLRPLSKLLQQVIHHPKIRDPIVPRERSERIEELKKKELNSKSRVFSTPRSFFNSQTCLVEDGVRVCVDDPELVEGVDKIVTEAVDKIVTDVDEIVTDVDRIVTGVDKIVTDTVDKIVTKNAGIVRKLKTAKQNLIGHGGRTTDSRFKPFSVPIH